MYFHVKVTLFFIVTLIVGGLTYCFRSYLPNSFLSTKKLQPLEVVEKIQPTSLSFPQKQEKSIVSSRKTGNKPAKYIRPKLLSGFDRKFLRAKEFFQNNEYVKARSIAENILLTPNLKKYSDSWFHVAKLISEINTEFLFTEAICPEKITYTVVKNDNLIKIANKFRTTVKLIQKSNNLSEGDIFIYPNQTFRIYRGDWNILVKKSKHLLILKDKDKLFKVYDIGIGKQNRTPIGTFIIDLKDSQPDWWQPGRVIKFGDPSNVLGTRWLGLKAADRTNPALKGYGIHGTWEPETIGHAASKGCIRMVNEHVEELFNIVTLKTSVVIED